jgi:hypothetical protein
MLEEGGTVSLTRRNKTNKKESMKPSIYDKECIIISGKMIIQSPHKTC